MPSLVVPDEENPPPDGGGLSGVYTRVTDWLERQRREAAAYGLLQGYTDPVTKPPQADPIWPTSNPVGTEKFVDYRGWDTPNYNVGQPTAHQATDDNAVATALKPAPNTEYGSVLPIARDTETGQLRIALPSSVRDFLTGGYDLTQGPRTGTVTPEGTMSLLDLALPAVAERPTQGLIRSFGGSHRAAREAATDARAGATSLLDTVLEGSTPRPAPPSASVLGEAIARHEAAQAPGILGDTPILRNLIDLTPEQSTVSTRVPSAARQTVRPHEQSDLKVGIHSAEAVPEHGEANSRYFANYPGLRMRPGADWREMNQALVNHISDNVVSVFDAVPHDVAQRNAGWYDGAHKLTFDLSQGTDYTHQNVAGLMAALSPQKDWYQNVELGKRLIDIDLNRRDMRWSPEMSTWSDRYLAEKYAAADAAAAKKTAKNALVGKPPVEPNYKHVDISRDIITRLREGEGMRFGDLDDHLDQAHWARIYDQAHNLDRSHREIFPDGSYGGTVMQQNNPSLIEPTQWGSFDQIANAWQALRAHDLPTLSRALGDNHKVRSFYNNIIHPNEPDGAVTADTHAIAAGLFRPVGSADIEVKEGLGSGASKNREMGNKGLYALYDEGYRQATRLIQQRYAQNAGMPDWHGTILPRQVQSVTWEAIRKLFNNKSEGNKRFAERQWNMVRNGEQDANTARDSIILQHGGYGY